ncbi:C-GCAxxG-C-C family (seleno)protein [Chloroflexota bacterium]
MSIVDSSFGHSLNLEELATNPHAGGLMNQGYQCGMLWGAVLAAGAQAYRLFGSGPQAETSAIIAAQRLVESFRSSTGNINCLEIIHTEMHKKPKEGELFSSMPDIWGLLKFFFKGGPIGCFRMAVRYAPEALREINASLSEMHSETPSPPVSCSAMLAQKMGVTEMHTIMTAGFSGGIGLSGGACGALGTAMWITGMNNPEELKKMSSPVIGQVIERFIKSNTADFRFECSEIVGRKFENIADHADYLHNGGCSEIIEVLAAR